METATLEVKALNAPRVDEPEYARRQMTHIATDRLTPWLEPYHPSAAVRSKEEQFQSSQQTFYRMVLSQMSEGCVVVDADDVVIFVNDAMETMFGRKLNDILGRNPEGIFEGKTAGELLEGRRHFRFQQAPQTFRMLGRLRVQAGNDGTKLIPVSISCRSIHGESGTYKACILVISDIGNGVPMIS